MARKKRKTRRVYVKKRRSRPKKKISLAVITSAISIPFVPAEDGYASPYNDAKEGRWMGVADNLVTGFNPIVKMSGGKFDVTLHFPRYLAIMLGGAVASKLASALGVNRYFANMPSPLNKLKI